MRKFQQVMLPLLSLLAAGLMSTAVYAKSINLLDEPKDNAKVTGTIDLSTGIIPIFTPKDGQWIKVGDPRNGNTGWVKSSDLKDANGNIIKFQQSVSENKDGSKVQSVEMSYGNAPLTPAQQKAAQQSVTQQQQQAIMQMQQNLEQAKKLYQQQIELMQKVMPPVPGLPAPGSNK